MSHNQSIALLHQKSLVLYLITKVAARKLERVRNAFNLREKVGGSGYLYLLAGPPFLEALLVVTCLFPTCSRYWQVVSLYADV